MFKRLMILTLIAVIAMLGVASLHRLLRRAQPSQALAIEQIQSLSSLVTARVQVADVMLVEQRGLTGGIQVAALIKGDYLMATDLAQARFEQVDHAHRSAILLLPPPQASHPRVDLSRSRLFGLNSTGLWLITPGDAGYTALVNKAYEQAQSAIAAASSDPTVLAEARRQAEAVLTAFLRTLAWEVSVRWRDQPTTTPSEPLTERNVMMTESGMKNEMDANLVALRSRLAEKIGYLAARRWLADADAGAVDDDGAADHPAADNQRIISYKPQSDAVDPGDSR